jgi:DNA-binding IclR family transcriptional regulator
MAQLQTLDRGIRALALVGERADGVSMPELTAALGVHKAIAYRLVATLEAHGMVARGPEGRVRLGAGMLALAARFEPQFRVAAEPELRALARETRAAAFVSVAQGEDCVPIMVEQGQSGVLQVSYRMGARHPLTRGAAGLAILAGRPPRPDEPPAVAEARAQGYSVTRGQLQPGAVGVAAPILSPASPRGSFEPCVGVVAMEDLDVPRAAGAVRALAARLRATLLEPPPR